MSFKKLLPAIKTTLNQLQMENPTPFQKKLIPKIKSGTDLIAIGNENTGKTTTLIIKIGRAHV